MGYLDGKLFVNTFSLADYARRIESGHTSAMGCIAFSKRDEMRYRFMMDLFGVVNCFGTMTSTVTVSYKEQLLDVARYNDMP